MTYEPENPIDERVVHLINAIMKNLDTVWERIYELEERMKND